MTEQQTPSPSMVLDAIRLIESAALRCWRKRTVRVMHAVTTPHAYWEGGNHVLGIGLGPNYVDDHAIEVYLYRCSGFDRSEDAYWNEAARRFSQDHKRGTIIRHSRVLMHECEIIRTDRRSDDARHTGFNDCYTLRIKYLGAHITDHDGYLQGSATVDDQVCEVYM